jgi:hypothetical protein
MISTAIWTALECAMAMLLLTLVEIVLVPVLHSLSSTKTWIALACVVGGFSQTPVACVSSLGKVGVSGRIGTALEIAMERLW